MLGTIKKWGFCSQICQDKRQTFNYANLNLLTDEECSTLLDSTKTRKIVAWNEKYEFCVGKKHSFPRKMIAFKRVKKKTETLKSERASSKKCK